MDGFASVIAGTVSPAQFFSADNIGRILAEAAGDVGAPTSSVGV
jgi:hypothetical protein